MKQIMLTAMMGATGLMMSGCMLSRHGVGGGEPGTPTPVETAQVLSAESSLSQLDVALAIKAGTDDAGRVAKELDREIRAMLDEKRMRVVDSAGDLSVACAVNVEPFDESGNFFVFDVDVETAAAVVGQRGLGRDKFSARGKRTLGRRKAVEAAAKPVAADVAGWVKQTLVPEKIGLVAQDLRVDGDWTMHKLKLDDYARDFVRQVNRLDGVLDCRVIDQSYAKKNVLFRVVFVRDDFPEGLLNRLMGMETLKLKPRR